MMNGNDELDIDQYLYAHHYSYEGPVECSNDVLTLSKLLTPPKPAEDLAVAATKTELSSKCQPSPFKSFTPASIGPRIQDETGYGDQDPESFWSEHNPEGAFVEPKYEIVYSQTVNAEDIFLGVGIKTPVTSSCNQILVKIWLPDTSVSDIQLDVQPTTLVCSTKTCKLVLPLPHPVAVKRSDSAKFVDGVLLVSLRLNREYEFLNN